jgi:thioredoxin-like negative regulator of GroEL
MREAHKPFWFILAVLCGLILVVGISHVSAPEIVPWRTDFASAGREADVNHKPLLAYFTARWCGPCQNLKHTTWADPTVAKALLAFVPVEIDVDVHPNLAARYTSGIVPSFVVLNEKHDVIKFEEGAMGSEDFLAWLNAIH